jgi:C4-dicarboxylate-specific signal transduction histidine kinase
MSDDRPIADLTKYGIPGIDQVPFGIHVCHFYRAQEDLVEALVPYFAAGLGNNENCVWVTPLSTDRAAAALGRALVGVDAMLDKGQMRIVDAKSWHASANGMDEHAVAQFWLHEEKTALAKGYQGLRSAVDTSSLFADDWDTLMGYEGAVSDAIRDRRILMLCSYDTQRCQATGVLEAVRTHQHTLERRDVNWEMDSLVREEALRTMRARLEYATQLATLAELSAAIAHEVNQPLAAVAANAAACLRWLSDTPPNLERARLTAERIVRDANSASDVVNRVRALFKHSTVATVPLNVNEVIEEVRQLMLDEASGGNVRIETDLEPDLPRTLADRVQMQQVIVNLVRNGIEAMDSTRDLLKLLSIRSRRDGSNVRVDVCDRGSGLRDPENVFKPFFTTKKTGMGMGLAICRSIIEAHRGRLWATQNEGWGTTFCFTLPILSNELQ